MPGGFQNQVFVQPAPAVAGDFATANPRFTVNAGAGGIIAGLSGLTVGLFAWLQLAPVDADNAPAVANNFGLGAVAGFVGRHQQGLITTYLANAGMLIPAGFNVFLYSGGDFWVRNDGSTFAAFGQKAYANLNTGKVNFAATGSTLQQFSMTGSIAASTFSVTGSINGATLTVTAVGSGTVVAGGTISGTGIATGTQIVSQITPLITGESLGGIGRYNVSIPEQTVASTTVSGTYGTMTITAATTGTVALGSVVSGSGVVAGTTVTQFLTGTGGTGTYVVNNNTVVASTTLAGTANVETKFIAMSAGAAGELIKISDHPLG